ncbi:DNA binding domain protein, excisionase family [Sulfobacillus acidophilus DSM 10332]|uniref:DNA binding domain protein, excisionase family n=1 Tax=Sulfobacillus acidophilus (strain ATCC 700253 / DSM 10332 / NAL) TaxID=679936 RepID=G8U118_SULAD|nr:DNA binding domain protein, excisionase family [Sulfobacillus acidophilus DSM 10332]
MLESILGYVPAVLTVHEYCRIFRVSKPTVYRAIERHEIRVIRLGGSIRIPLAEAQKNSQKRCRPKKHRAGWAPVGTPSLVRDSGLSSIVVVTAPRRSRFMADVSFIRRRGAF